MPGWRTTLRDAYVLYDASGSNATLCTNFTPQEGHVSSFSVDNIPPPGGLARTIGFWKNWTSCSSSNGKQRPILDRTLALAEPAGIALGVLTLHGSASDPNRAPDCDKAVRVLSKSVITTGVKKASDPTFNLAAQLLAASLNVVAGAGGCGAATTAISDARALLTAVHFNGVTHDKLSSAQASNANLLASALDRYNNDTLC
jgi:hypothetical protein